MLKISDKVEVFFQEKEADIRCLRGVRARYDISVGESLVREQPVAWILSANDRETYCHYCFVELNDVILCTSCHFARYCGEECKTLDETYHMKECKGLQDMSPVVPSSSVRLLARVAQLRCQGPIATKVENKPSTEPASFPSDVKELQSNISHLDKHQFLTGLKTFKNYLSQSAVPDDVDVVMEIFGQIECNSFDVLDVEQKSIGAAIFLRASMFNHSCEPNCVAVFDGIVVEIRTIKDIKSGQECVISYCELLASTHERQTKLSDQFHFTCTCNICQQHQEMESEKDVTQQGDNSSDQTKQQREQDLVNQSLDILKKVEELSNAGKFSEGIELCNRFVSLQRKAFSSHHYIIVRTLDALIDLYVELGDGLTKAAELGDETLDAYRYHYPCNYPSIAWQLRKVGLIHSLLEDHPKKRLTAAIKLISQAKEIFLVSHGEEHPLVSDSQFLLEDWTNALQEIDHDDPS